MPEKPFSIETHGGIDKRARRTRELLADALMSLGARENLDEIVVSDLTDEAGVSRSTFYQHYASKDDFMVRSFVNMLASTEAAYAAHYPDRTDIVPSWPLLRHVGEAGEFVRSLVKSEVYPRQMAAGEAKLRTIAEANIERRMPHWSADRKRETAVYIAGGFIGLLRWWMESGLKRPAEDVQAAFARLAESALAND